MQFDRKMVYTTCVAAVCCLSLAGISFGQCPMLVPGEPEPCSGTLDSHQITVADFDRDGRLDVAIVVSNGYVQVHLALPGGGYAPEMSYPVGSNPSAAACHEIRSGDVTPLPAGEYWFGVFCERHTWDVPGDREEIDLRFESLALYAKHD